MQILFHLEEGSVRDVIDQLAYKAAYTTVMTTLARLSAKGVLTRRMVDRKFLYRSRFTEEEWRKEAAMQAAVRFLGTPTVSREVLMSCLRQVIALQSEAAPAQTHLANVKRRSGRFPGPIRNPQTPDA